MKRGALNTNAMPVARILVGKSSGSHTGIQEYWPRLKKPLIAATTRRIGKQLDKGGPDERLVVQVKYRPALLTHARGAALVVRALPWLRFRNSEADPQREQRRQNPDEVHRAPRAGPRAADIEPNQRRQEKPNP